MRLSPLCDLEIPLLGLFFSPFLHCLNIWSKFRARQSNCPVVVSQLLVSAGTVAGEARERVLARKSSEKTPQQVEGDPSQGWLASPQVSSANGGCEAWVEVTPDVQLWQLGKTLPRLCPASAHTKAVITDESLLPDS